jgi:hypothetical protein
MKKMKSALLSLSSFGLVGMVSMASALAGQVLSDDTRLTDLAPGATLRLTKPLRVCSGETASMTTWFHPNVQTETYAFGGNNQPLCKVLPSGTGIPITSVRYSAVQYRNFQDERISFPAITLDVSDDHLNKISVYPDVFFGHNRDNFTIKDLRRAMKWGVWIEGADTKVSSAAPTEAPAVAAGAPAKAVQAPAADATTIASAPGTEIGAR